MEERLRKDALYAKVVTGIFEGSDHNAVLAKTKICVRWKYGNKKGKRKWKEVIARTGRWKRC